MATSAQNVLCVSTHIQIGTGTEYRRKVDQVFSGHFSYSGLMEDMDPSYLPADVVCGHSMVGGHSDSLRENMQL